MKLSVRIATVLAVFGLMALGSMGTALADDGVSVDGAQILPDVGPQVKGLTPGIDGYKVFGPDAIKEQSARSRDDQGRGSQLRIMGITSDQRIGYTDIWKAREQYDGITQQPIHSRGEHDLG
ncbi:MAG: hypothetical protein ABIN58_01185 [candidate division WOR-3 bacterium]